MPELPEVETTVRGLARYLEGQRIARVAVNRPDLRRPFPPGLVQALTGASVTTLGRRAKYGLIHTNRGQTMVFHLGMSGRWRIEPDKAEKHDHLVLETGAGHVLALNDARRFGSVDLIDTDALNQWPPFAAMGPEPLGEGLSVGYLKAAFAGRSSPVKPLLLDQRVVAGLGNIYVCEALHRAHIRPDIEARTLVLKSGKPSKRLEDLADGVRTVLIEAIDAGGSTLRDFRAADGNSGYFQHRFAVYDREGEPCPTPLCRGTIKRIVQSGRSSFFCPTCQH